MAPLDPAKRSVFLINPAYSDVSNKDIRRSAWKAMPMGLLYLASALEQQGHAVKILDMEALRLTQQDLTNALIKEKPFLIGCTAATPMIRQALALCRIAKELLPDAATLVGGPHATLLPEEILEEPSVDIVVRGEGELTVTELAQALSQGTPELDGIPGIHFRREGRIVSTQERPMARDLDSLPFPAWHLIDLSAYQHPLGRTKRAASVLTSRGCPSRCTFCSRGVFGHQYRERSPRSVLDEIDLLRTRHGIREIFFIDDTLTLKRSHIEGICRGILEKGWDLQWATPNGVHVHTLDRELLSLMKRAGCYSLAFGIESGNQETLDRIHKRQTLQEIQSIFRACRELEIETTAFIIIGFPNEDREMILRTLRFLKELKPDVVDIHTLIPLPGTQLYEEISAAGQILERDWTKYVFHNLPVFRTPYFTPEEIHRQYKEIYLRYHLRPAYILQRLRRIRSWREVSNNLKGLWTLLSMAFKR